MLAVCCWKPCKLPLQPLTKILCVNTACNRRSFATRKAAKNTTPVATLQDPLTILEKDDAVQLVGGVLSLVEDYLKRVNIADTMSKSAIKADSVEEDGDHVMALEKSLNTALEYLRSGNTQEIDNGITKLKRILDTEKRRLLQKHQRAQALVQSSFRASYYRGGTSRAIIFNHDDIPMDSPKLRDALFLQAIGSPDPHGRQLNGMGAGVSSLSKICIIKQNRKFKANQQMQHLDYTFVGMGIEGDEVDFAGNCGNMAAAIGPYAFNRRIIPKFNSHRYKEYFKDGTVTLLIRNTNTNVMIRSTFEAKNGEAVVDDSTPVDGVSGLGTRVLLDFLNPGGSKTGKLLPTGNAVDIINGVQVSCVDSANPCVFVRASDIGINPTILPSQLLSQPDDLRRLEEIREAAAVMMGLCKEGERPARVIPKIAFVSPPVDQTVLSGEVNPKDTLDLVIRFISDGQPHRASPLTGALCTATAAKIPGSVVNQCVRQAPVTANTITIGHSSGRVQVNATMDDDGDVECVSVIRTARRIMEGEVYVNLPLTEQGNPGSASETGTENQTEDALEEESLTEQQSYSEGSGKVALHPLVGLYGQLQDSAKNNDSLPSQVDHKKKDHIS